MSARTLTFTGFALIIAAAIVWTAVTAARDIPTLRQALAELMRPRPTRMLVLLGWAWIGWHLFVRTSVFG